MPLVRPVGESNPPVVFTDWLFVALFEALFVAKLPNVPLVPKPAVFVAPPVMVTPAPPVPPRAVVVLTTVG